MFSTGLDLVPYVDGVFTWGDNPPSADLAVEAKPVMPAEAVRSEAAGIAHDIAIEGWGERGWATVGRLCRWMADSGLKGLNCPPSPELPPKPG
ncbi:hypothetical protein [Brevundimonas naejangsanensis]